MQWVKRIAATQPCTPDSLWPFSSSSSSSSSSSACWDDVIRSSSVSHLHLLTYLLIIIIIIIIIIRYTLSTSEAGSEVPNTDSSNKLCCLYCDRHNMPPPPASDDLTATQTFHVGGHRECWWCGLSYSTCVRNFKFVGHPVLKIWLGWFSVIAFSGVVTLTVDLSTAKWGHDSRVTCIMSFRPACCPYSVK